MQFITIQNIVDETIAINPKRITQVCYGLNKQVLVYVDNQIIHTKFTDLFSAVQYIEQAAHDRMLAAHRPRAVEDLWRAWGDQ
jgi:hypothetical protein